MRFLWKSLCALSLLFCVMSCATQIEKNNGFLQVKEDRFIDPQGRQVILNGINYISKNPEENYMRSDDPELFRVFRDEGINVLRLGIIWDGLEPEPGQYNEAYLKEIDKRIEWAAENDLYVFLDMHQDLFSVKYGDGAPEWATLDEDLPHVTGDVWSDAYLMSPAVQTAFDNFWNNTPAEDGVGIQDRFAQLWKHIAERYADNRTVIGYDILNEPFIGSDAQHVMPILLTAFAGVYAEETGVILSEEELGAMWSDVNQRLEVLRFLEDRDRFASVIDELYDFHARFDREKLQPMYQRVADAIREVDTHHLLLLEHGYFSNMGVSSVIEPVKRKDGSVDPRVVYAAHGYDLVVDTDGAEEPSYDRVDFIFDRIYETGKRMGVPVLVGEWGAYYTDSEGLVKPAQQIVEIFEKYHFGQTYWSYYDGVRDAPYYQKALLRSYPASVAGELISYGNSEEGPGRYFEWKEDLSITEPTLIYLPDVDAISIEEIKDSAGKNAEMEIQKLGARAGYLVVPVSGEEGIRRIEW